MPFLIKKMEESVFYLFSNDRCVEDHEKEIISSDIDKITESKDYFKQEILNIILNRKKKLIKSEVQVYQTCLCRLLNVLYRANCDECLNNECFLNFRKPLVDLSIELLTFLKRQYGKYFDYNMKLPLLLHQIEIKTLSDKIGLIEHIQNSMSDQSCNVSKIIKPLLASLSNHRSGLLTFHEKHHIDKLLDCIIAILKSNKDLPQVKEHIFQALIIYNWNTSEAINCLSRYIKNKIEEGKDENEKFETLQYYFKWINQIYCDNDKGFKWKNNSLQSALSKWLKKEIKYFKATSQLTDCLPFFKNRSDHLATEKIRTNLSVAQIASLIRQLINTGIVDADNKKSVIRIFTNTVSSKNTKDISIGSLKAKYYSPEASVDDSVKEIIYNFYKSF
ncbi:MAG: hypothetical protein JW717_10765 [Marinilabiliaceae bacterium]|nr:hypothetical protein [Marinilabiliaceae bacterium]